MKDQDFLKVMVQGLVAYPEQVSVDRSVDEMGVLLTLSIAKDDMGKIIGREGNTAKAIRHIMRVFGMKAQSRVNMKILEPEGSTHERRDARPEVSEEF